MILYEFGKWSQNMNIVILVKYMNTLEVTVLTLGALQTNCYLVKDILTSEALIIDPADAGDYIVELAQRNNLKITRIIATHGHFDHIMAGAYCQLTLKVPFFVHTKDTFLVNRMKETAKYFDIPCEAPPPKIDHFLKHGDVFKLGENELTVLETPGHTPGSICLYSQKNNLLFSGDTLFAQGQVGRTDFAYCSTDDLKKSLSLLLKLPPETKIYPGHGPTTTINQELMYHSQPIFTS